MFTWLWEIIQDHYFFQHNSEFFKKYKFNQKVSQHTMNPQILEYFTMYVTLQNIKSSQEDH